MPEGEAVGSSVEIEVENLDKVYVEASQWVRMCNAIIWQMAAVFIPVCLTAIGLALAYPKYMLFFGIASIALFSVWVYVSQLYRGTAADARKALMEIERSWQIPAKQAVYCNMGQVGFRRMSLFHVQIAALLCLIVFWFLFYILRGAEGPPRSSPEGRARPVPIKAEGKLKGMRLNCGFVAEL